VTEPSAAQPEDIRLPHEYDHRHSDVSGGWLRAATFGAMDGLVSNTSLIAGVGAASVEAQTVVLSGVAGLVAGAFSMALGEYTSVTTQNEQLAAEVKVERRALQRNPRAEAAELTAEFVRMGMSPDTAARAAAEVSADTERALDVHITQELGVDPEALPSPYVAATSSFATFSVGALIPLIPYLLGFSSLIAGLLTGYAGLLLVGALTARFTRRSWWQAALRQLILGAVAIGATYAVGSLIGVGIPE
jgi:VIT1/CCC1 family predicted Fe2+/Mn2+ transporter